MEHTNNPMVIDKQSGDFTKAPYNNEFTSS